MNQRLEAMLYRREAEGRPLTDEDLREFVEIFPERKQLVDHYREGRNHLPTLCDAAAEHVCTQYPMVKFHQFALEKTKRDMPLLCWYAGDSMLLQDVGYARDNFLYWFRTIVQAFDFPKRIKRQFGPASASASAAAAAPAKRGLFGMSAPAPKPAAAASGPAGKAGSFEDRVGEYVLNEVKTRKLSVHIEPLFEGYTFIMWSMKDKCSAECAAAWEPYISDARDQICARYEPEYATTAS